jgi:benzylsuccinate CoA-transferase BbsF subunit
MRLPFDGIRITDFCWIGAGAYTTKMLADMGADVIKIESATYLDSLRLASPYKDNIKGINRSGYFADRNSSKRSVTVNLKTQEGLDLIRTLVRQSDIVANNFAPGTMERLGLGYEALSAIKPDLVYVAMSMHGGDGPESKTVGYGITISAITGLQYLTTFPGKPPAGTGTNFPDHIPNPSHACFAILAALRHRRRTGEGQQIDLAQTEPMLSLLAPALMDYSVNGRIVGPTGNRMAGCAPRGVYPCRGEDRWIAISVATDAQWAALVECLAAPDLGAEMWQHAASREADQDRIDEVLARATLVRTAEELMAALQARGVPAGVAQNAADLIEHDPQLRRRGHWRYLDHPEMGRTIYNGPPFAFASGPVGPRAPAPLLGQHTDQVCRELGGMDDETIARLKAGHVLT